MSYPGDSICKTGTVALAALGIIDYLRTENSGLVKLTNEYSGDLIRKLKGYIESSINRPLSSLPILMSFLNRQVSSDLFNNNK